MSPNCFLIGAAPGQTTYRRSSDLVLQAAYTLWTVLAQGIFRLRYLGLLRKTVAACQRPDRRSMVCFNAQKSVKCLGLFELASTACRAFNEQAALTTDGFD